MRIVPLSNFQTFTAVNLSKDPGAIGGPVVVPSCAQIVLSWLLEDGKIGHNVLYGRYSGSFAGSSAQANAILAALTSGSGWTGLQGHLATTTNLGSLSIRDVNTPNNAIIPATVGGNGVGTGGAVSLPNEVAAVITLRSAQAGRGFRGRIYVPGFDTASNVAGNIMGPTVVTGLQGWANIITAALAGSGYTLVIGQKARAAYTGSTGTQHPARPAGSVVVTSLTVKDNHWDSQRRRGLK